MEIPSVSPIWGYLAWLPKWLMRWKFSEERMANLVNVDIRPRHENVKVNLGLPCATFELWFQVTNMSPFGVELDRAQIDFLCHGGMSLCVPYIKKIKIRAGKMEELCIAGDIPDNKADQIARYISQGGDKDNSSISMDVYFNCRLHAFAKLRHRLDGVKPHFINQQVRIRNA
ncbi:MAG: hypothetical protein OXF47_09635 [Nitrospira sp.]|nr:hypothetical protein [Nitrospira sp.]